MIFLGPLYTYLQTRLADHINHFPLIRLVVLSLDKTILYLLVFALLRFAYLRLRRQKTSVGHELLLATFVSCVLLLLFLTVFRGTYYYPWQLVLHFDRPLSVINTTPLVETLKLRHGATMFDFYYQSLGNIGWFMPFGLLAPLTMQSKHKMVRTIIMGSLLSLSIETMQFFLITGVSDIDDWIFNTIGVICGYLVYALGAGICKAMRRP
jgi:glycopeptide antibiotics resistance protein